MSRTTLLVEDYGMVSFNDDEKTKERIFKHLLDFFMKHQAFGGEVIFQSDAPLLDAPELLSELADEFFEFKTEYDHEGL